MTIVVVCCAAIVAGCSSSTTGSGAQATASGTTTPAASTSLSTTAPSSSSEAVPVADLPSHALAITDLPAGWAVDNSSDDDASGSGCAATMNDVAGIPDKDTFDVSFVKGDDLPSLDEDLASVPNAKAAFDKSVAVVSACKQIDLTSDGQKITGPMGQMSYPALGDESAAFTAALTAGGYDFDLDMVMVRKGDLLCMIVYVDQAPVDVSAIEPFVSKAVAKL